MLQYIVIIGASIQVISIILYIRGMLYRTVKPNKVTWLMRSLAPMIGVVAAFSDGVRRATLPLFMSGFWSLVIFIVSFFIKNAYRKIGKYDYICAILSLLAIVGWGITKEPLIAIIFAILSDIFAAIPTIVKSFHHPETEWISPYLLWLINNGTSFFAMKTFSLSEILFPIYLLIFNISIVSIILRKRIAKIWWKYKV